MRCVRVVAPIRARLKVVPSGVDLSVDDRVVRRWVRRHAVQQWDLIYAGTVYVNRIDPTPAVWVVVTDTGLVRCISDPPIGRAITVWPALVNLVT